MSNGGSGNVRRLDTANFGDTIASYERHLNEFCEIVTGVRETVRHLTNNWKGRGANAFETDSRQVQLNLQDITEIMQEMKETLEKAYDEYKAADSELSTIFSYTGEE